MSIVRKPSYPRHRIYPPTRATIRRAGARRALKAVSKGRVATVHEVASARTVLPYSPHQLFEHWRRQGRELNTVTLYKAVRYVLHVYPHRISHLAIIVLCFAVIIGTNLFSNPQLTSPSQVHVGQQSTGEIVTHESPIGGEVLPVAPMPLEPTTIQNSAPLAPAIATTRPDANSVFDRSHILVAGETLGSVAAAAGVTVETLIWANGLQQQQFLVAGQQLRIPRVSGLLHTVEAGETVQSIAARYHTTPATLTLFGPNDILADQTLQPGQVLFVPGGTQPLPEALLARFSDQQALANWSVQTIGAAREAKTNVRTGPGREYPQLLKLAAGQHILPLAHHEQWVQIQVDNQVGWVRADLIAVSAETLATLPENNNFDPPPPIWVWPARGTITSPFGTRWGTLHNGIDIANAARTPIVAARSGHVTEAGWCSGFGYCVKIEHEGGVVTIYGHMITVPAVHVDQDVEAGQFIGLMGSTYDAKGGGFSTGVHLHFTVKVGGKAIDPMKVLP